jgi:hypothetical protein
MFLSSHEAISLLLEDFGEDSVLCCFLKVLLDHFAPNLYISNNNPVFEPVYTVCINRDLSPGDNRYFIEIKSFSSMNAKMLSCLIRTETVCLCGFMQTV